MAKLKKNEVNEETEEVIMNPDAANETTEDVVNAEVKNADQSEVPPEKVEYEQEEPQKVSRVKIRVGQNHKCNIGGVMYDFKRGEVYHVPEDVKRVLYVAGVLTSI